MIYGEKFLTEITVYSKSKWYESATSDQIKSHFTHLMKWLDKHDMLSSEGKELMDYIGSDFSLHSRMLNKDGNKFIKKYYDKYLKETKMERNDSKLLDSYSSEMFKKK